MNESQIKQLKESLSIDLNSNKINAFEKYMELFLNKNACINLISKKDEEFLFEKHIFDSLAINKFLKSPKEKTLLDIGTGGGFPSVPLAILYENLQIFAMDSIKKKINAIEEMKLELNIDNLHPICGRVENDSQKYDYVTTRAVATLDVILKYAVNHLKEGGYFIAYKSKKAVDELKEAQSTIKKLNIKLVDIIEYTLPLEEIYERNLMIFKK